MVDKNLLLRKIADLEGYMEQIKEYSSITIDEYRSDWKVQRIIERTLQMMIEVAVDIANHIISDGKMRIPESYADTFRVLFENRVIDEDIQEIMIKMSKFRNIVVHQYESVNPEIVVNILKKGLTDLVTYKDAIIDYVRVRIEKTT